MTSGTLSTPPIAASDTLSTSKLSDDPPAARAQCDPNADLARSMKRTRQQQIRDVRARNQQNEHRRAQERPIHDRVLRTVGVLLIRHDLGHEVLIGLRVIASGLARQMS